MKLSIITLGQSPRKDFEYYLKGTVNQIEQYGILDNYDLSELEIVSDNILVSRLRNGNEVKMESSFAEHEVKKIVNKINKSEKDTDLIMLACTGEFEDIESKIPIVYPDKLVGNIISSVVGDSNKIGVLIPNFLQEKSIREKWNEQALEIEVFEISPYFYSENDLSNISKNINDTGVDIIVCDCMGYSHKIKEYLTKNTTKKVILSNEIVFKAILSIS